MHVQKHIKDTGFHMWAMQHLKRSDESDYKRGHRGTHGHWSRTEAAALPAWGRTQLAGKTLRNSPACIATRLSAGGHIKDRTYCNPKFLRFYLFTFREGKKHQCVVASHATPTGDLARNLGMCTDWESNQWPFGSQAGTQSTKPHQTGPKFLKWDLKVERKYHTQVRSDFS